MTVPLVSVILISYKKFEGIFRVLDSILNQTYPRLELILQDDGSPDFAKYEGQIQKYITLHKKENIENVIINHLVQNVGTSRNINAGIRLASGKYMKLATADDAFYSDDMIGKCVKAAERLHARILIGQTFVLRRNAESKDGKQKDDAVLDTPYYRFRARNGRLCTLAPSNHDISYLKKLDSKKCRELLASRCIISTPSVFYRMDLLRETGGFLEDYRLIEDMTYWPYLAKRGEKFHFVRIRMMRYELNGISNTMDSDSEFFRDYKDIMEHIYIANEVRGGIFCEVIKKWRLRYLKWTVKKAEGVLWKDRLKYSDAAIYDFYCNLKYLLTGSKL